MENFEQHNDAQASISMHGTLRVIYLNGRNGPFPIGTLETTIGTFTVRDSWLETFDAGEYDGIFEVCELSLYTYRYYGESRTAMRAVIESYALNDFDMESEAEPELAPDPLDEEVPETVQQETVPVENDDGDSAGYVELLTSFADSDSWWEVGDDYVIDSTIGRHNMRRCKEALVALGYEFNPLRQCWTVPGGEA